MKSMKNINAAFAGEKGGNFVNLFPDNYDSDGSYKDSDEEPDERPSKSFPPLSKFFDRPKMSSYLEKPSGEGKNISKQMRSELFDNVDTIGKLNESLDAPLLSNDRDKAPHFANFLVG